MGGLGTDGVGCLPWVVTVGGEWCTVAMVKADWHVLGAKVDVEIF